MNTVKLTSQPCLKAYHTPFKLIQASPYGTKSLTLGRTAFKKTRIYAPLAFPKERITYLTSKKEPTPAYINRQLSLIKDPLWKRICIEVLHLMGPVALQIFQVQLSIPQERTLDLYCHTEEIARFLHCYNFIILDALKRYFPSLKHIRVNKQISAY